MSMQCLDSNHTQACGVVVGDALTRIKTIGLLLGACALSLGAASGLAADAAPTPPMESESLTDAIAGGAAHLSFRYRYENVDQDPIKDQAHASTLRSRLNYLTGAWHGLTGFVEADNVISIGNSDLYNSTTNNATNRPIVADPTYTEVNQAYLQFKSDTFTGIGGRQGINLDNQRFIGTVAWRQNEQTYDAVVLKSGALPKTELFYSYVDNVHRVTGPDDGTLPGELHSDSHFVHAKMDLGAFGTLALFDYLLDFHNSPAQSSDSYGFFYTGAHKFSEALKLNWIGSVAQQSDYGDNPSDYTADYYLIETGLGIGKYGVKAGYEVLGGNKKPQRAFQTPLATLHMFQGWADKFLVTPTQGVEDFYIGGSANFGDLTLQLIWHDFQAEATNSDYGTEWDASAAYKFSPRYEALLKFADYREDGYATDTTKVWLQLSAAF